MNFNNLIDELRNEITEVLKDKQVKLNNIEKEWVKYTFTNPNSEKKLQELEKKFASAKDDDVEQIGNEIKVVRDNILKYELEKKEKERKIDVIYDETKFEILKLIKRKIIKIKKSIDIANEEFITYAKNISEAEDSVIDLKSLSDSFRNFDKVIIALDVLNKYNGRVERQSLCNELIEGLNEENKVLVKSLYKIITFYLIDMRQEVKIEEENIETPIIFEEPTVNKGVNSEDILAKTEEIITEVTNNVNAEEIKYVAKTTIEKEEEKTENKSSNVKTDDEEFLKKYEYLTKNEPTEEDIINFVVMYDSLKNVSNNQKYLFEKIIREYNTKIEFEKMNKDVVDYYTFVEITLEVLGKPYKLLAASAIATKINKKRLVKNLRKSVDKTLSTEAQQYYQAKVDNIINTISSNYIISGANYYINLNKLAQMKFKLHNNGNKMLSERFERKFNKVSNKVAKTMNNQLNKLAEKNIEVDEAIYLILDQYLELLSICKKEKIYLYYANFYRFLEKNASEQIFNAYNFAANMILDYRKEYNFIPYELKKSRDGIVYNEIEDIIEYYVDVNETLKNPERGMYIKNQNIISKTK